MIDKGRTSGRSSGRLAVWLTIGIGTAAIGQGCAAGATDDEAPAAVAALAAGSQRPWVELGARSPVRDRNGAVGVVLQPSYVDIAVPGLMTALVCADGASFPHFYDWRACRPATSRDGAVSWTLHDSPQFAFVDSLGLFSPANVARSPANPHRMYFAVAGHPWESPDPRGGLWRSDDDGATWTDNLFAGQAGEAGLVRAVVPDPDDADRVYIGRGYDFGNISRSDDGGQTFQILCGHSTTEKTGLDEICGGNVGTWTIDFANARMYYKHHFQNDGVELGLDGTALALYPFAGLDWNVSAVNAAAFAQVHLPVRGLARRAGGSSAAWAADGSRVLYQAQNGDGFLTLWRATPDFRSGQPIPITSGRPGFVLAHPTVACTWVAQAGDRELKLTRDCGDRWSDIPTTGLDRSVRLVSAAWGPASPHDLVVFTRDGRRFKTNRAR
jgi:hypothetical protein